MKYKLDADDNYQCYTDTGKHIGFIRHYWDGWRAHDADGKELSSAGCRSRKDAAHDFYLIDYKAQ